MDWRTLGEMLYRWLSSSRSSDRLHRSAGGVLPGKSRGDYSRGTRFMTEEYAEGYRDYVAKMAFGIMPSEQFFNRNEIHAGIVVEHIFLRAERSVQILTHALSEVVYGTPHVVSAATTFLARNSESRLDILVECDVSRSEHPLLRELNRAGFGRRVDVSTVPPEVQKSYRFNFAVADGQHYRFEESRESRQAVVQVGAQQMGERLMKMFAEIKASISAAATA